MTRRLLAVIVLALLIANYVFGAEPQPPETALAWHDALVFVAVPAAFGGLLQSLYKLTYGDLVKGGSATTLPPARAPSISQRSLGLLTGALFGLGGGSAIVLAAFWLNKFDLSNTDSNKLYLIVLGVVSGFVGYRILPRVARGLEERMAITELESRLAIEDALRAVKEATDASNQAQHAATNAAKAERLATVASLIHFEDYRQAKIELLKLRNQDKLHRYINTSLSFVCKLLGEYEQAIDIMSQYMEDLSATRDYPKADHAVALYNRACYRALLAKKRAPQDISLLQQALRDLEEAIREDPQNREYALEDEYKDFEVFRDPPNVEFYRIIGKQIEGFNVPGGNTKHP